MIRKDTIRDVRSTALYAVYIVDTLLTWFILLKWFTLLSWFTLLTGDGWMGRIGHSLRLVPLSRI